MKIQLNSINFYDDISPQEEIIDSSESSTKLVPFGKSGIHIKKENRGSFTSYCGGKVTNACIQKGKNSPSAAIRKKATFAANARKWKHQLGGTLLPGVDQDISKLFVDTDELTEFDKKKKAISAVDLVPDNVSEQLQHIDQVQKPIIAPSKSEQVEEEPQYWYHNASTASVTAQLAQNLRDAINKHINIYSPGLGNYDCSNFVSRVFAEMGRDDLSGTSRDFYSKTDRIDRNQIQPGDLIFLQDTQDSVPHGQASHVAIITNTDRLGQGIIQVASGSPRTYTTYKDYNLNDMQNILGYGRIRPRAAKRGMKFQLGGLLVDINNPTKLTRGAFDYSTLFADIPVIHYNPPIIYSEQQPANNPIVEELPWYRKSLKRKKEKSITQERDYSGIPGYGEFKKQFDLYTQVDPDAKKYEKVLTDIAQHESNFNPTVQNRAGAPAFGYFQFWQDGRINNITQYSGLSIDDFLNDPQAQIAAAVKMARSIEHSFNSQDLKMAQALGYNMESLIKGAWLGGVGGVRQVLRGTGDPSDRGWYGGKGGTSVKQVMNDEKNLTTNT